MIAARADLAVVVIHVQLRRREGSDGLVVGFYNTVDLLKDARIFCGIELVLQRMKLYIHTHEGAYMHVCFFAIV